MDEPANAPGNQGASRFINPKLGSSTHEHSGILDLGGGRNDGASPDQETEEDSKLLDEATPLELLMQSGELSLDLMRSLDAYRRKDFKAIVKGTKYQDAEKWADNDWNSEGSDADSSADAGPSDVLGATGVVESKSSDEEHGTGMTEAVGSVHDVSPEKAASQGPDHHDNSAQAPLSSSKTSKSHRKFRAFSPTRALRAASRSRSAYRSSRMHQSVVAPSLPRTNNRSVNRSTRSRRLRSPQD